MLDYVIIGYVVGINLLLYLMISLPLDFVTYRRKESTRKGNIRPDAKQDSLSIVTYFSSMVIWFLMIWIAVENLFDSNVLYHPWLTDLGFYGFFIQFLGIVVISCATVVAIGGRISRWNRAFSWGIPIILETGGMYRYIRHPLYASYCYYFIGFLFIMQNPLLLFLLLGILGYYNISKYEEEILIEYFGLEYITYRKKTKRFIPFVW